MLFLCSAVYRCKEDSFSFEGLERKIFLTMDTNKSGLTLSGKSQSDLRIKAEEKFY